MRNQGKVGVRSFFKSICGYLPPGYLCCCSLLIIILQSAFTLLLPFATMKFIDRLKENQRDIRYLVLIAVLFLLQLVISAVMLYAMTYLSQYVMKGVRNGLWNHILELPVEYFDAHDSGEIMSRISNDTQVIKEFITTDLVSAVTGIITVVGSVFYLFWIDWRMTLLMLGAIPVTVFAVSPVSRKVYDISKNTQDELAGFQKDLERVLSNVRLVKLSLAEQDEKKAGEEKIQKLFCLGLKEGRVLAVIQPFTTMVIFLLLVLIFGYGSIRVANHTLSAGGLVAIVYYLFQIVSPCTQMTSFFAQLQKALGAYERILVILDRPAEHEYIHAVMEKQDEKSNKDMLSFQNISFGYDKAKPLFQEFTLDIEIGKTTAIVGPSGAGKTTLFSLLERFYIPQEGCIYYKGVDINGMEFNDWRRKIAYVSQEAPLMSGSIHDNLVYGLKEYCEEDVAQAIRDVELEDFVSSLPNQINTEVGERGVRLSGGQRQRIAIARAMIRNPEILLLDEATAHLDSCTEMYIQKALQKLMEKRTTLVIAHRLSTVQSAAKIVILEKGKISGSGTHKELLKSHPLYEEMIRQQFVEKEGGA